MTLFGKLFPETLFPRKLSADAEQRLRISQARAEEALVRTHVENALLFVETLAPDVILHAGDIGDLAVLEELAELAPLHAV
ncbi:MAG: hypothetical protein ABMA00_07785, partial [Gemmatimonas sp.]